MTYDDLQLLLDYHYWARDRTLEVVERLSPEQFTRDLGSSFPSVRDTLAHTLLAERLWCMRWQGESSATMPSTESLPDIDSIRRDWIQQETEVRRVVGSFGENGLQRVVHYRRISGNEESLPFWRMVQHVVNHATYHRGQVMTMLRQLGAAATSTDLTAFYRERAVGRS